MTRRYANLVTADLQAVHERVSLLSKLPGDSPFHWHHRKSHCLLSMFRDGSNPAMTVEGSGTIPSMVWNISKAMPCEGLIPYFAHARMRLAQLHAGVPQSRTLRFWA